LDALKAENARLKAENDRLEETLDYESKVMEDFAEEEFGSEKGTLWLAPFTARKFVEMVRDRIKSLRDGNVTLPKPATLPNYAGVCTELDLCHVCQHPMDGHDAAGNCEKHGCDCSL
jgi:hypothetical protein